MPDLLANLVYFHSFEELVSNNFLDRMGAMNLAQVNGVAVAPGKAGQCADFTAAQQQYCFQNSNPVNQVGDIDCSWAMWVKPRLAAQQGFLFSKEGSALEYYLLKTAEDEVVFVVSVDGSALVAVDTEGFAALAVHGWNLIVCYHDAVNDRIGISANGQAPKEVAHTGGIFVGTNQFRVGGTTFGSYYWEGGLDELGCWKNRVLNPDDIQELWNGGNGLAWQFQREPASGNLITRRSQNVPGVPYGGKGW